MNPTAVPIRGFFPSKILRRVPALAVVNIKLLCCVISKNEQILECERVTVFPIAVFAASALHCMVQNEVEPM
jgi:hypothetical protein